MSRTDRSLAGPGRAAAATPVPPAAVAPPAAPASGTGEWGSSVGLDDPWNPPPGPTPDPAAADAEVTAGLDHLDSPVRTGRRVRAGTVLAPAIAAVLLLLCWQCLVWAGVKPVWILPGPAEVWSALSEELGWGGAAGAIWTSLSRGAVGFAASLLVGTVLGLLLGHLSLLGRAIRPLLSGMQSLPSVAWVPAAVVWFRLSDATIYAVILLGAVPSIAIGLMSGLDQAPPALQRAGRVLGAGRLQLVRHVLLPAALPTYLAGVKQGWAFAWRSLMAAEIIVQSPKLGLGLGQLLNQGRDLSDMSLVIATILLVLLVGVAVELLCFAPLERRVLRRRGLAGASS